MPRHVCVLPIPGQLPATRYVGVVPTPQTLELAPFEGVAVDTMCFFQVTPNLCFPIKKGGYNQIDIYIYNPQENQFLYVWPFAMVSCVSPRKKENPSIGVAAYHF